MNFNNILFLDIETVSQEESYHHLDNEWKELWNHKTRSLTKNPETDTPELLYPRAAIYAEFGKIICISCGCIQGTGEEKKLSVKSFSGEEKKVLQQFADMIEKWWTEPTKNLCAHNGKEFDYPYLCRRMIANGVTVPEALKLHGKKPWEVKHLMDTMEMWKFGDFKSYTSLRLLAKVLGVPSPKDDIDGSMVNEVYYVHKDLERIVEYCQKDVITLAQVLLGFHCEPPVKPSNIEIKTLRKADA